MKTIDDFDVLERDGALTLRRVGEYLPGGSIRLATVRVRADLVLSVELARFADDDDFPQLRRQRVRQVARAIRGLCPDDAALGRQQCFARPGCRACGGTGHGPGYRRLPGDGWALSRRPCEACGGSGGRATTRRFHDWLERSELHASEHRATREYNAAVSEARALAGERFPEIYEVAGRRADAVVDPAEYEDGKWTSTGFPPRLENLRVFCSSLRALTADCSVAA